MGGGGGELRYEISQNAYIKLVLYARKHKTAGVNGVLVGRVSPQKNDVVEIPDSVPRLSPVMQKNKEKRQKKKQQTVDPNKPKKSAGSYFLFSKESRKALLEERPGTNNSTITALISVKWEELNEEEKQAWNAKAAEAMEAYKKELEEYNNSIASATDDKQQPQKELTPSIAPFSVSGCSPQREVPGKRKMRNMPEKRNIGVPFLTMQKAPSLVDLCVKTTIDNVRYLGDVGETDLHLLDRILPHCTFDQLMHVENSTKGRDLTPVTDKLWKKFYKKEFGEKSLNVVIERMKEKKVAFRWKQLYEAKVEDLNEAEKKTSDRLKKLYQKEDAKKQSRQTRLCSKVPPSSNRRSFGNGPGYGLSGGKLMKKAKIDFLKCPEVKNLAALRKNAVKKTYSSAPTMRGGFSGKDYASTSKHR
ncbi:hypothetical protein LWI29_014154 [Acer saccharum]|uniref:HMG box domain-containing protein n=1 Tax=Acer saccharum TaxID=4024 RepID=A0AA39SH22_ACESA|nr:hypothetical protein LWI29_014154 [Acer saccharum]